MIEKGEKTYRLSMLIKTWTKKTKNDDEDIFDEESRGIIVSMKYFVFLLKQII